MHERRGESPAPLARRRVIRRRVLLLAVAALGGPMILEGCAGGPSPDGAAEASSEAASEAASDGGGLPGGIVAAGVRWFGRVDLTDPQRPRFSWSGTGFVASFVGTSLSLQINNSGAFIFKTVIDGAVQPVFVSSAGQASYDLATGLASGVHTVELYRQTEGSQGDSQLLGLTVGDGALLDPPPASDRLIEVVGDSIACGYGALGTVSDADCFATESHWDSFGAVTARALGADLSTIAVSGQGVYRNYDGDMTNTLPMVYGRALTNDATPTWTFATTPQVVVINLGTNDISNGKGDPGAPFQDAYLALVETIRERYPRALILCMIAPLLSGSDLVVISEYIRSAVEARTAAGDDRIELWSGIQPQTTDKQACASHPNPAENQLMADLLTAEISLRLGW
jgi:lysophospholipase L1-like esterase